ncbi:MAG: DUF927 domain-containing protein [Ruminococcus sp.]|nr:DUF927 domain-containing protein [Ruminococcus sp.]
MIKHKISKPVGNSSESKPKISITAINGDTTANSVPFRGVKEKEVSENNFDITHETRKLLPRKSKIFVETEKNHAEESDDTDELPIIKDNSYIQTAEDFEIEIYSSVEVSEETYRKLMKNAVQSEMISGNGKRVPVDVIKVKNAYAMKIADRVFKWLCSGFTIIKKAKSTNGEVSVEIQVSDDLDTSNITVSADVFAKANLKDLNKYNIYVNIGYEMTASIYFQKILAAMPTESAKEQLGFSNRNGELKFTGYENAVLKSHNTFRNSDEYIKALNELISDSIPIQYLLSASMSAALMSVLKLKHNIPLHSYIINAVGTSSTGKTISSRLCASMWSDPCSDKIFTAMLSTNNAMFKRLGGRFGVPMFLDESTIAGNVNTAEFGYTIYEEREKYRLNPDCTEKSSGTWNTVVVMSSEEHFHTSDKSQNGGLVVRIHNAENLSFTNSREHADRINNFISHNYGVLGKVFVNYLMKNILKLEKAYESAKESMRELTVNSRNAYTDRLVDTYALTYLTANILCKLGLEIDFDGVAAIMQEQNKVISCEYNLANNALQAIQAYVAGHENSTEINRYCIGNDQSFITSVAITENLTAKILAEAGFKDLKTTIKELDKAGYLIRQGKEKANGLKSKLHINRVPVTCYQFKFASDEFRKYEHLDKKKTYDNYSD